jgi:hypothetical protein
VALIQSVNATSLPDAFSVSPQLQARLVG